MSAVAQSEQQAFFEAVDAACKKAVWCAVATVDDNEPRVRIVHPTWDGQVLWFATGQRSTMDFGILECIKIVNLRNGKGTSKLWEEVRSGFFFISRR